MVVASGSRQYMPGLGGGYVNVFEVDQDRCVGCNLCSLLCPVQGCIINSHGTISPETFFR